jgi:2-methylcitrate dehydratase PrpD
VTLAVLRAVGGAHRAQGRGFRTSSIGSPIGATVACARLLGLDLDQTLNAMGIVGACANKGLMPSLSPRRGNFGDDKDWVKASPWKRWISGI